VGEGKVDGDFDSGEGYGTVGKIAVRIYEFLFDTTGESKQFSRFETPRILLSTPAKLEHKFFP